MIIFDAPQLGTEWWTAKIGLPSAGGFNMIVTSKGEPSDQRKGYMYQLAGEIISNKKAESPYKNGDMERGTGLEPEARQCFEFLHDVSVRQVGLIYPDEQKKYAASPDGLLEDSGLEVKCPKMSTHIGYLLDNKLPTAYFQQVMGGLLVSGFTHWWFLSYYPGLPPFILRVERNEKFIDKLKAELDSFCLELSTVVGKLKNL